jgi:hypothetical protein
MAAILDQHCFIGMCRAYDLDAPDAPDIQSSH